MPLFVYRTPDLNLPNPASLFTEPCILQSNVGFGVILKILYLHKILYLFFRQPDLILDSRKALLPLCYPRPTYLFVS